MQLEDYFNFIDPKNIRLKGTRVGIETLLNLTPQPPSLQWKGENSKPLSLQERGLERGFPTPMKPCWVSLSLYPTYTDRDRSAGAVLIEMNLERRYRYDSIIQ